MQPHPPWRRTPGEHSLFQFRANAQGLRRLNIGDTPEEHCLDRANGDTKAGLHSILAITSELWAENLCKCITLVLPTGKFAAPTHGLRQEMINFRTFGFIGPVSSYTCQGFIFPHCF